MLYLLLLFPLLLFLLLSFAKFRNRNTISVMTMATYILSFLCAFIMYKNAMYETHTIAVWDFFSVSFHIGTKLNAGNVFSILLMAFLLMIIAFYSIQFMKENNLQKFFRYYTFFSISIFLFITSIGWLQTFFCWEWMGLSSFYLIGFFDKDRQAVLSSRIAIIISKIGDMAFLFGMLLIISHFGTDSLSKVFFVENKTLLTATLLIGVGVLVKGGQYPFHLWLLRAMKAPTPISALLHSSTLVVAGVLFLSQNVFLSNILLNELLFWAGIFSSMVALIASFSTFDIKKILAYTTIAHIGIMFLALGLEENILALEHLYSQAMSKSWLFLIAGYCIYYIKKKHPSLNDASASDIRFFSNRLSINTFIYALIIVGALSFFNFPLITDFSEINILEKLRISESNSLLSNTYVLLFEILSMIVMARIFYPILRAHINLRSNFSIYYFIPLAAPIAFFFFMLNHVIFTTFSTQIFITKSIAIALGILYIIFVEKKRSIKPKEDRLPLLFTHVFQRFSAVIYRIHQIETKWEARSFTLLLKKVKWVYFYDKNILDNFFESIAAKMKTSGMFLYYKLNKDIKLQYAFIAFITILILLLAL